MFRHKGILLMIVVLLLSGCWDVEEADRMDYVHGVAIDYKDGETIVQLQLVNLGVLGTPDTATTDESTAAIVTASATNINEAIYDIYKGAQRRIYWGHTTFILISEAALKENKLAEVLDLINRFSQTRYRIQIAATQEEDLKGMMEVTPLFKSSVIFTNLTDISNTFVQGSLVQPVSIRELIIALDEPGHNGIIPAVRLDDQSWTTDKGPSPMIVIDGVASVTKEKLDGFILGDDIRGLRWFEEDSERNDVTIEKDGEPASELVIVNPKANFKIETDGDKPKFHITIRAKGMINAMLQEMEPDEIVERTEKKIEEEVMNTYKKGLEINSDVYRLSEKLYRRHVKVWKKVAQDGMVPLEEDDLKVEVKIDLGDAKLNKTEPLLGK